VSVGIAESAARTSLSDPLKLTRTSESAARRLAVLEFFVIPKVFAKRDDLNRRWTKRIARQGESFVDVGGEIDCFEPPRLTGVVQINHIP
jgi:hypothetical protein